MRAILISFFILASAFIASAQAAERTFPQTDYADLRSTGKGEVAKIIDPMTVSLKDGRIIRLTGIDFPDFNVQEPGEFSVLGANVLKDMLEGQAIEIYQTKKSDSGRINRMGHHLAHLKRASDDAWVQGTLLDLGLARVLTTQRNTEQAQAMLALEAKARAQKIGLWEKETYKILTPEESADHLRSFQIVEGTVVSTAMNDNRTYLNFGPDWRSDFTVTVEPGNKRPFSNLGIDLLKLNGQKIRVRGWVDSYNGPFIEIDHPESLEILSHNGAQIDSSLPLKDAAQGPMLRTSE